MIATVGSVAEISAITVPLSDGRWVRLDQIARVTRMVMRGVHLLCHQF